MKRRSFLKFGSVGMLGLSTGLFINSPVTEDPPLVVVKDIDKQLDQVDLIVMHGQFSYQIPLVPGLDFHDQYFFESICTRYG